ncbi:DedA family protein [Haloarcula onubensis]|uniref:DedA family protein n=1 Tax=Haloarcula onubensis TaxID=2950539 RepID=A0ABU2FQZ5_9EURY|nr:DedA family protein [Halomicroarcula sp. S3CR25-11]MDS0282707.1 DedA family protein [Halomicroarcula sp. S3CR25-11]
MVLETSLLLHFVPSEVVLPVAAALLVVGPLSFAAFVLVATAGATVGSLVAYVLFGRNGARVLDRYGRYVHVSQADLDRWQGWYRRWGESSVFWGRLLPFVRALVSVPAGAAAMPPRTFVVYSAAGSLLFNASLTYLVYAGPRSGEPVRVALATVTNVLLLNLAYIRTHPSVVLVEVAVALSVALLLWHRRAWIRAHPGAAKRLSLAALRLCGGIAGLLLISAALSVPAQAFASLTWVWNNPRYLLAYGLSQADILLLLGVLTLLATGVLAEIWARVSLLEQYRRLRGSRLFRG